MQIKFPFDSSKPVAGEASIDIGRPMAEVFTYVGTHFFDNYPKWADGVVDFEAIDGKEIFVGAKAKQVRSEKGVQVASTFAITEFEPQNKLALQGIDAPYRHSYLLESGDDRSPTHLTFRFELLEVDVFMRSFEKLIRSAIEDGAENTVENIKNLLAA